MEGKMICPPLYEMHFILYENYLYENVQLTLRF